MTENERGGKAPVAKTIWKYALGAVCAVEMPKGAQLLSVHEQDGAIFLWALVDLSAERETRTFAIFGTGESIAPAFSYVGSLHMPQHGLVFHVFEKVGR